MGGRRNIAVRAFVLALAVGGGGAIAPAAAFESSSSKNFSTPSNVPAYFAGEGAPVYDRNPPANPTSHATAGPAATAPIAPANAQPRTHQAARAPVATAAPRYNRSAELRSRPVHHAANIVVGHVHTAVRGHGGHSDPPRIRHANSSGHTVAPHSRQSAAAVAKTKTRTAKFAQRHG